MPLLSRIPRFFYGIYVWIVFTGVTLPTLGLLALMPGAERRRGLARGAAKLVCYLSAIRLEINGATELPAESCIVVANHASYLDGILLTAALPARFAFVIKREMTMVPMVHFLLRRVGAQFVERFDPRRSATDARRLLQLARSGHSLVFFPEGTFHPEPGLRRFHAGAFRTAVNAGLPVVPVTILGTRHMLPSGMKLPRPGRVRIHICACLQIADEKDAARLLLAASRVSILSLLDEPDLSPASTDTDTLT